ncbi:deoxynucleoside kinase [Mycoplasmopsis columbina]|uniref:Deoxyguanosine kinase n=1 Tax=Mycoplasmopsis columbina SF7 TaxID=1037410 RepID=F9UJT8_9BACT|nr:deoxynucleoside kinase [Mycoplasmopsis columbina]EGV00284.1 deoxyguanosine kinase [Mycoplasmopsis columbina SF7]VEU76852.1 Deoxyguanosine kinase [Mycoplasmopsis columbina]
MIIAISGMIGAGKSTLAKALNQTYADSILLEEFANDDIVFNTFLKWLYEKKENIDIGFQAYILESLSDNFQKTMEKYQNLGYRAEQNHVFLDRFNLEHYIFAVATLAKKPPKYLKAFDAMFHEIIDMKENPDLAIFLDISFETFKERIFERGRESEISNFEDNKDYFLQLHDLYKELFIALASKYQIPYFIIEVNNKSNVEVLSQAIQIIENFKKQ